MDVFELLKRKQRWQGLVWGGVFLVLNAFLIGAYFAGLENYRLFFLCLNLPFLMICLWWLWWHPYVHAQLEQLKQTELQTEQLLEQLKMSPESGAPISAQLQRAAIKLKNWQTRDAETRQLVRVQGLIDHELAIGNRLYFESRLEHYLKDKAEPVCGALFLLQITHPELDVAPQVRLRRLRCCVEILTEVCGGNETPVIARLAENDLALLLPGLCGRSAERFGDKLIETLGQGRCFDELKNVDVMHIGFSLYEQGQTSYRVLAEAEMALKTAQLHGPNATYGFVDPNKTKTKGAAWWRQELSDALREGRFLVSFQPVFSWQDEEVLQHEALIQLQSSEGERLASAVFMPMAAHCGLLTAIDQFALQQVALQCNKMMSTKPDHRYSVNISTASLLDENWWGWFEEQMKHKKLPTKRIALELHEYHLHQQFEQLKTRLLALQSAGFALVIDQVGLSLTPMPYMNDLPISMLKIHTAVVRAIDQHIEKQLFVRGLLASCTATETLVIATAVESEAEWLCLKKLGVAGAQGYYFSQQLSRLLT